MCTTLQPECSLSAPRVLGWAHLRPSGSIHCASSGRFDSVFFKVATCSSVSATRKSSSLRIAPFWNCAAAPMRRFDAASPSKPKCASFPRGLKGCNNLQKNSRAWEIDVSKRKLEESNYWTPLSVSEILVICIVVMSQAQWGVANNEIILDCSP